MDPPAQTVVFLREGVPIVRKDRRQLADFDVGLVGLGLILAVACLAPWALERCGVHAR